VVELRAPTPADSERIVAERDAESGEVNEEPFLRRVLR
jgi:hypothetical protein